MATIKIKNSSTTGGVPLAGNLQPGELAINTSDGKLYFKASSGQVKFFKDLAGTNINDLGNVIITNVADKQVLAWDTTTSKWVNKTPDAIINNIDGLEDVTSYTP